MSAASIAAGKRLARVVFASRERKKERRVEVHLGEDELAVILATAFELGAASVDRPEGDPS